MRVSGCWTYDNPDTRHSVSGKMRVGGRHTHNNPDRLSELTRAADARAFVFCKEQRFFRR